MKKQSKSKLKYWQDHFKKFGVDPKMIGMIRDPNALEEEIYKAIDDNIPYNEYEQLTTVQQEKYNNGLLIL